MPYCTILNCALLVFRCNVVINFFEDAHKVTVSEEACDGCGSNLLQVDFSKVHLPFSSCLAVLVYVHHILSCFTVLPRYTTWSLCRITDMAADSRAWAPVTILLLHYQCMLYLCVACILLCVSGQNTSGRWGDGAHRLRVLWPSVQDAGGEAPRRHAAALGRRARSGARRPGQRPPGRQGPGKT